MSLILTATKIREYTFTVMQHSPRKAVLTHTTFVLFSHSNVDMLK